ncbi:hypothetical protein [Streptomyces colonosanans]|uniref:Knr4/Smi1-like domain-containing protein n=1 Tax=Streptomyces colonosanans TaxID=1428652 RepID=A0A1S2P3N1_9ACTN|nr:hypothetical protein [Streptomyces colonosanans]OIJ88257.1 hypothetical protein BIV24_22010 [Streptomyces colonosanans]
MDEREELHHDELLQALLACPGTGDLVCEEPGHPAGHSCLAPSADLGLPELQEAISGWFGRPRNLAMGGYVDPSVTGRTGLPLLAPFGERIVEMRAWAYANRWIGCGAARDGDGDDVRLVVLVAERDNPAADMAEPTSWVDGVVAVTGWETTRVRTHDWAAVEARLGTSLPGDYKRLVEAFGAGAFDGYLQLQIPDAGFESEDIVRRVERLDERARTHGSDLWRPYKVYPAPGGLLKWGSSVQADGFYWLTEDPDPDRWPVLVTEDIPDSWERFDGPTAEFVYRSLTEREHPFSMARYFDAHWFQSYETGDQPPSSAPVGEQ